ncbi:MAG: serine/threonine-protein kinase [Gemmatimonadales bacterium]|jgi:serine/threonine-protein kinase
MDKWIGRYQIIETLGKGGMGVVYGARDPELERDVAIKVVLGWAQYDEDAMARFNREARVVAQLQHPHIVTVFDAGRTDEGLPYFVMEYLEGTDLGKILERQGSLSPARAVGYIRQVCDGLAYAHAREIVHRDIKPANLLITPDDNLKIVDFGIAKLVGTQITGSGVSLGTPLYMAPEQVAGRPVDHRADIFAVGGVLYTALAGRSPFEGPTLGAICTNIENAPVTPLAELGVDVHPRLEAIIRRALEKAPEDRYQKVSELAENLRNVSVDLEAAASAPTVITPQPGAAAPRVLQPQASPPRPHRRFVWLAVALIAVAAALWAWPSSPLRSTEPGQQTAAEGRGATNAGDTPSEDESGAATGDSNATVGAGSEQAAEIASEGAATGASSANAPDDVDTAPTTSGPDPASGDDAAPTDADAPTTYYPASPREREEVSRIVTLLVRGLEKKDSTAIARAFGGELTPFQWNAFRRLFAGPRLKIRHTVGDVGSSAEGMVVAEVHNDILFLGAPRRVPPPRKATWVMRFRSDPYGELQLESLRLR